jgi:hypothetical protein
MHKPLSKHTLRQAIFKCLAIGSAAVFSIGVQAQEMSVSEMNKYLLIGTTSDETAQAVDVQNGDLGADIVVLSDEIDDNVDFDLHDVFINDDGSRKDVKQWVNVDNKHSTSPDFLPGAAQVGEGVSWTGDVALTSPTGYFNMSNVELYGQVGVVAARSNPVSSVSNSEFFPNGVGDGFDKTGNGQNLPPNGVSTNTSAMAALRSELDAFEQFVTDLAPEATLSPGNGLPTSEGIEDVDYFELNVDQYDTNNDGIAVIDIEVGNGDKDFKLTNSHWVIESVKKTRTRAIFRILGDSNLVLNQSTIVVGDGILGNGNTTSPPTGGPTTELGAIFIKANDYNNGKGGRNSGEAVDSGDTTFNFNDTVLNGVGFYDLIIFDEQNNNAKFDNGTTELVINNGQGCAHFISPKINFNNVRFERCAIPEGGPVDTDEDGVPDETDNCPLVANADQADVDNDGMGDACDAVCAIEGGDSETLAAGGGDNSFTIEFLGKNGNEWSYKVSQTGRNLSHWSLGIENCQSNVTGGTGSHTGNIETGPGGNSDQLLKDTGVDWMVKWDTDGGVGSGEVFTLTLNGDYGATDIGVLVKTGGNPQSAVGTITAPNCSIPAPANCGGSEPPVVDTDEDTIPDETDNCPLVANADQANMDGDSMGDACDDDTDGDSVANETDNCPLLANQGQENTDGDDMGDACDPDTDGDSVANETDNCPLVVNPGQENVDGDTMGDACDPDTDGDNVANENDNCPLVANPGQENADSDDMGDACDPLTDTDGDNIANDADNCPAIANPGQKNADGDNMGDACDPDTDGDNVANDVDNCPLVANPGQENADSDDMGDACDPLTDTDGDNIANDADNCPLVANPGQENADGDNMGDACDPDTDGDNVGNDVDNCPYIANPGQENADGDNMGDACDNLTDSDGDNIANDADNCPLVANPGQENADGDAMGDACDPDTDGDNVANDVDNCPYVANPGQENADSDDMGDACDPLTDTDDDNIANDADNCPAIANPGQENADGDDMGDACDPDTDGDNVANEVDNCPYIANPGQENADGDDMGDACDDLTDSDDDGVADDADNCPAIANPGQENADGDAMGDACDDDTDGDNVANDVDNCPLVANPGQENADGDDMGDACDDLTDSDDDGIADDADNCPAIANPNQENADGDDMGDACDDDTDGDDVANDVDNCPAIANPNQENADGDDMGDACDDTPEGDNLACSEIMDTNGNPMSLLAKFNWDGGYFFDNGTDDAISISNADETGGTWLASNGVNVAAIIVKGGTDTRVDQDGNDNFSNAGLVDGDGNTIGISNIQFCGSILEACDYTYGVHDGGKNNTQILRYSDATGIEELGPVYRGYDIEALDISKDGVLYGASGDDTANPGVLYEIDMGTGNIIPPETGIEDGIKIDGCNEIDGISFHPSGQLWGWDQVQGLVIIADGVCTTVVSNPEGVEVEDLSWDNAGQSIYFTYNDHVGTNLEGGDGSATYHVGQYTLGASDAVWGLCNLAVSEIEAIEVLNNGSLLLGYNSNGQQLVTVVDVDNCSIQGNGSGADYDIEGLAVCPPPAPAP